MKTYNYMNSLKDLFWQGRIEEGYGLLLHTHLSSEELQSAPESIGLLVFKGDLERAEILFRKLSKDLDVDALAGSLFYLMIGHIRKSQYSKALKLLKELKEIYNQNSKREGVKFYFAQGVAFYSYYRSDFEKSLKWSRLALKSSLRMSFPFGELVARDLLGGALVSEGQISQGLTELEKSLMVAERIGNGGFVSALRVSLLGFRSRFGSIEDAELELSQAISDLDVQDTYSLSDLKLELARQLILKGQVMLAEQILNECSALIYSHQNHRQAATLHHRLAFLMYVRGQYQQALTLLQVAGQSLDTNLDHVFVARLEGLKQKILKQLDLPWIGKEVEHSDSVHKRIQARSENRSLSVRQGEDPLGDKIDGILGNVLDQDDLSARLKRIVESELWYFLPEVLNLDRIKNYVVLGVQSLSVTLYSQGEVVHLPKSSKGLSEKLILSIAHGEQSKELLINQVWGYEYDPLRHDSLVYSLVAQLRKQFENFGHWIEMTDEGYVLKSGVEVMDLRSSGDRRVKSLSAQPVVDTPRMAIDGDINFRQNEWLGQKGVLKLFSIQDYRKYFGISNMTAFRDIDEMVKKKRIQRSGFGRATRYHFI